LTINHSPFLSLLSFRFTLHYHYIVNERKSKEQKGTGNIGEITGLGVALKEKGTKQVKEMSACLFSFSLHAHTY